jgi:phosphopantothenoylcysteine decarboxylase/phosphopantothenate--cysteine ligase
MGYALAEAVARHGADVVLVSGPVHLTLENSRIQIIRVTSAAEMLQACEEYVDRIDVAIFSAAVSDYAPEDPAHHKLKKGEETLDLRLRPTPDIAAELGRKKRPDQLFVGFALETEQALAHGRDKLRRKNFDLIVVNSLEDEGAGFGTETNKVSILDKSGNIDTFELKHKNEVARDVVDRIIKSYVHAERN